MDEFASFRHSSIQCHGRKNHPGSSIVALLINDSNYATSRVNEILTLIYCKCRINRSKDEAIPLPGPKDI
jgi:hypothetical protein